MATIIIIAILEVVIMARETKATAPMMETMATHKMETITLAAIAVMETMVITHLITPVTAMVTQIMEMAVMETIKIAEMGKTKEILMSLLLQLPQQIQLTLQIQTPPQTPPIVQITLAVMPQPQILAHKLMKHRN
jgi:hypothetical protein